MEQNYDERIQQKIRDGFRYDLHMMFQNGWEIWKKVTLPIAGALVLWSIPLVITYVILLPWIYSVENLSEFFELVQLPDELRAIQQSRTYIIRNAILTLGLTAIFGPFTGGVIAICREADKTGSGRFGTIFSGYSPRYLGRLLTFSLLMAVIGFIPQLLNAGYGSLVAGLGWIFQMLITLFTLHVYSLVMLGNLGLGQAIGASVAMVSKKFFPTLGIMILFGIVAGLGILICGFGLLFSISFYFIALYMFYKQAIGFPEDDNQPAEAEYTGL